MKRRWLISIFTVACVLVSALALAACQPEDPAEVSGSVYTYDDLAVSYEKGYEGEKLTDADIAEMKELYSGSTVAFQTDGHAELSAAFVGMNGTVYGQYSQDGADVTFWCYIYGQRVEQLFTARGSQLISEETQEGVTVKMTYRLSGEYREPEEASPEELTESLVVGSYKLYSMEMITSWARLRFDLGQVAEGVVLSQSLITLSVNADGSWLMRAGDEDGNMPPYFTTDSPFGGRSAETLTVAKADTGVAADADTVWGLWSIDGTSLNLKEFSTEEVEVATKSGDLLTLRQSSQAGVILIHMKKTGAEMAFALPEVKGTVFTLSEIGVARGSVSDEELLALQEYAKYDRVIFSKSGQFELLHRVSDVYGYEMTEGTYLQNGSGVEATVNTTDTLSPDRKFTYTLNGATVEYVAPARGDGVQLRYIYRLSLPTQSVAGKKFALKDICLVEAQSSLYTPDDLLKIKSNYNGLSFAFGKDGSVSTNYGSVKRGIYSEHYSADEGLFSVICEFQSPTSSATWWLNHFDGRLESTILETIALPDGRLYDVRVCLIFAEAE